MDGGPFVNVYLFGSRIFDPLTTSSQVLPRWAVKAITPFPPFKCYHFFNIAIFKIEATGDFHYIHSDILKTASTDLFDLLLILLPTQCEIQIIQGDLLSFSQEIEGQGAHLLAIGGEGLYGEALYPCGPESEEKVPQMDFKKFS